MKIINNGLSHNPDGYNRIDEFSPEVTEKLAEHYKDILELIGEDNQREGLEKTPERVAKALQFLTQGYGVDPAKILESAKFKEEYQQMVLVKDIELYSMFEDKKLLYFTKNNNSVIINL